MRAGLLATNTPMQSLERLSRAPVVVVANDQEWASRSLESLLGPRGYAVRRVPSGRQALELVRAVRPDALILDTHTHDLGALEICRLLRDDPEVGPGLPVIVTANDGSARAERLEVLGAGAWDYCTQPLDGEVLLLKLATFLRAKQELDRALDDSLVDELTGLYSFRGLARRAREVGAEANRRQQPLACIAFAPVGDAEMTSGAYTPGATGSVAERVAGACRSSGRVSDVFGRMGTTEFAVLAPGTDDRGVGPLVARLQQAVAAAIADIGTVRLLVGVSTVADYSKANVDVMEMLLRATDELRRMRVPVLADAPAPS